MTAEQNPPSNEALVLTSSPKFEELKSEDNVQSKSPDTSISSEETEAVLPRNIHGFQWALVITAIYSSIFLYALDTTIIADIQAVIVADFDALDKLSWLSAGFLLGGTATDLLWGKLYGQLENKTLYLLNVFLFEAGSAICGSAPGITAMVIGRVICGVGGMGLYVGVMSLIARTTTMAERPLYVSGTGLVWGIGIVLGPIVGGALSQSRLGWRWAFYINLVVGGAATPVWLFLLPKKDPLPGVSVKKIARQVDWVGTVLQMSSMVMFIMATTWGGVTYPWASGKIIGLLVGFAALYVVFIAQQVYAVFTTEQNRLIPVEFFKSRTVLILFASTASCGSAAFVPIYFVPIFFQYVHGDGPLAAGVRLLPFIVVMVVMVLVNGALMAKWGYAMPWYLAGGLVAMIGGVLMYTVTKDTSTSKLYGFTVLIGAGVGMWLQASFSVAQAVVKTELIPAAVGFITFAQILGITISIPIANSVFLNTSTTKISQILPNLSVEQIHSAIQGSRGDFISSLAPETRVAVIEAIVSGVGKTYILTISGAALVAVLSLFMKRNRLFVA